MIRKAIRIIMFVFVCGLVGCAGGDDGSYLVVNDDQLVDIGEGETAMGSIDFKINFAELKKQSLSEMRSQNAIGDNITTVNIVLTRDGYGTIEQAFTAVNNVVTGQIDDLDPGFWHVHADVYDDTTLIYTGEADVEVLAGISIQCTFLFDPVIIEPTQGSISFLVGLNPVPGYRKVSQTVGEILMDEANSKMYIFDSAASYVRVYNADNLNVIKDIPLNGNPSAIALSLDNNSLIVGYANGKIHSINVITELHKLIADALMDIQKIIPFTEKHIMVLGAGEYSYSDFISIDIETGQMITTVSPHYRFANFAISFANQRAYAQRTGVSPGDIHRAELNFTTGEILGIKDSRYHGDYRLGNPTRVINSGTRIVVSSGNVFISSTGDDDITYCGQLGYSYVDLVSDDNNELLYLLSTTDVQKLLVLDHENYYLQLSIELEANPKYIFQTPNSVVVFVEHDGGYYMKNWSKEDLI